MSYLINDTDLSTIGIMAIIESDSCISVDGFFDYPKRKGTTERSWGTEIEAFVNAADISHEGRGITFRGLMLAATKAELLSNIAAFKALITDDELSFATPYGTINVVAEKGVSVSIWNNTAASFEAELTQQTVTFAELTKVASGGSVFTLAGYSLHADFGIYVLKTSDAFSIADRIEVSTTDNYKKTSYRNANDIELSCIMVQDDMTNFAANMGQFQALLASPGMKTFIDGKGASHSVYVKDSFSTKIRTKSGNVVAAFTLKIREV